MIGLNEFMQISTTQWIYWSAALVNTVGVLVLSKGLSNSTLMETDPILFGPFGLCMLMVWGGCYYACSESAPYNPKIGLIFTLEKLVYFVLWIQWINGESPPLAELYQRDLFAGLFYTIYGLIDVGYAGLFSYTAYKAYTKLNIESLNLSK